ncbi:MAG TPA: hypothetical protein VGO71_15405 [Baekduia sp.]|jgi:hypothetical protein|nr:hypothetical protein [Baekduia sp.]
MLDETPEDAPTGLPEDQPEEQPLGVPEADPDGEHTEPGPDAMPGIPNEGEPPAAS